MYFWKIHQLRSELELGELSENEQFKYFIALATLWGAVAILPTGVVAAPEPVDASPVALGVRVICLSALLALMVHCYRQNGGASGRDFLGRFIPLFWVTTVQLAVVVVIPITTVVMAVDPEAIPVGMVFAITLVAAGLPLVQLLMVARHLRLLAARGGPAADRSSPLNR